MAVELTSMDKVGVAKLLGKMMDCNLFIGKYDTKHGNKTFMYGVLTVMEYIANEVDEKLADSFSRMFIENLIESDKKGGVSE